MLELTSPRWRELRQTFGSAEDIPSLLDALASMEGLNERAELWYGLWATTVPDGKVFTVAYAVVPHLLHISASKGAPERVAALHLIAEVEIARHVVGAPPIPDDLILAYASTIESLPAIVAELASQPWDEQTARIIAAALLVGKRQPMLAKALLALGSGDDVPHT
ncbi:MAG: hypothetical protein JWM95_403 [Gemmatimonadetes bacterium]|nr:hypothetical protein [Gemmatimonadota bacterium]